MSGAVGKRVGNIDSVILASANDEDRLAELLSSFQREYPEIERPPAIDLLKRRLEQMLSEGEIGIYESVRGRTYSSGQEYRDLPYDEAVELIGRAEAWEWAVPPDAGAFYHLFAKD